MVATQEKLVIEFGDDRGRNPYFAPIDRRMRGRFHAAQLAQFDKDLGEMIGEFPDPIPGQRLEIDPASGEVVVLEPLVGNSKMEAKLKARNLRLSPAREAVNCDISTAAFYAKAAVEAGQAIVFSGSLPPIDETKVRRDFFVKPQQTSQDKLTAALDRQSAAFDRLADALEKALAKR